ncbi:sensor histidine kinase [Rudanella paleaurantiibacter]|uniref:Sensor histidine kinase n=1 Tax=Rudanella paleaurantiibacter TaxID=2614655 RepID=A0A7J5TX94_9BACT|nr:sensor histidine kinase [Rudanella paleaurantiibacter]KAB7729250.1 sensor histidine kinase [Rudanella paleaurantiibacter]
METPPDSLLIATIAMLIMAIFIVIFVAYYQHRQSHHQLTVKEMLERHRQELMAAMFRGQEAERRRLAQDLHDDIGTMLSVAKMTLNQLERSLDRYSPERAQAYKTRQLLDDTLKNVRRISRDLVPTTLERFGLLAALEELVGNATNDQVRVQLEGHDSFEFVAPSLEVMLYRIVQELVTNAVRHSGASQIVIQFFRHEDELRVAVLDNGRGFDIDEVQQNRQRGLGLRSIESRLSVVEGHVTFDVAPGRGSRVIVQVPLENPKLASLLI